MSKLSKILKYKISCKSIWFMRQAGRYLPEFKKIRLENENFINLCLNSKLSSEITLQPIKRYDLDSAIIFSDILMIPYALGQNVKFIKNKGPVLSELNIKILERVSEREFSRKLSPIYKAIDITRKKLNKDKSLISFVGAPWTLLVYMLGIKNPKNGFNLSLLNNENLKIRNILEKLIKFSSIHIKNQINAGSDVVQIFDSWAGLIPETKLRDFCFGPTKSIIDFCKKEKILNICFPKGLNKKYENFNEFVKPDGINIDYEIDPIWAKKKLKDVVIQGGLNPNILLGSEEKMFEGASKYISIFKDTPYVFNLGHGLLPETDPDRVDRLVKFYRNYK